MLSRDDGISCSFCPLRVQAETWVASEAAPSTSRTQAASQPCQKGAGREGDRNGVTGNKVRAEDHFKNEFQGPNLGSSLPANSTSEYLLSGRAKQGQLSWATVSAFQNGARKGWLRAEGRENGK